MEDDGLDRDARVAGQGVAEVAELPAGLAVDEQDAGLVVGHLDGDGAAVVVGPGVAVERPDGDGERCTPAASSGTRKVTTGREPSAGHADELAASARRRGGRA